MVNEHLDVESHWLRDASFSFRWQHNRDRGGKKEAIDTEELGRAERETY